MSQNSDAEKKLALNGGSKAITKEQSVLEWPILPEEAKEYVNEILNGKPAKISINDIVDVFTDEFIDFIGAEFGVPLCNGTAGLFSSFSVLGVGQGDEVIAPSYTYWASVMPAAYLGAKIVFADIDPKTLCLDPADVESKITDKTKVIVPVHVWGYPADMDPIMKLAKEHGIHVIEDASHAHGAVYKGKKVGIFGDMGIFSLQGSKLIPAGEGGILVTDNVEYYEKALAIGHYERLIPMYLRSDSPYAKYQRTTTHGFKFRMSPLHAAIALAYLERYEEDTAIREKNCVRLLKSIEKIPGFSVFLPPEDSGVKRVFYENYVLYDETQTGIPLKTIVDALKAEGARVSSNRYPLLHQQPYFQEHGYENVSLPVTEDVTARLISLPNFSVEDDELVDQYIEAFEKISSLF